MNNFQTIRQTAHETGLPEGMLRARLKRRKLPGFYAESRYYINVPLLMKMIDAECRWNASIDLEEEEANDAR